MTRGKLKPFPPPLMLTELFVTQKTGLFQTAFLRQVLVHRHFKEKTLYE